MQSPPGAEGCGEGEERDEGAALTVGCALVRAAAARVPPVAAVLAPGPPRALGGASRSPLPSAPKRSRLSPPAVGPGAASPLSSHGRTRDDILRPPPAKLTSSPPPRVPGVTRGLRTLVLRSWAA